MVDGGRTCIIGEAMILKLALLAVGLVLGACVQDRDKPTIYQALQEGDEYLLLWRHGIHFVRKCVDMKVISTRAENRTIVANISKGVRHAEYGTHNQYTFRTYKNGSSFTRWYYSEKWGEDVSNYKMNYTSPNKTCFVVTEVTRGNMYDCHDANGCEVWLNQNALSGSSAECPTSLDDFDECIRLCPKPEVSLWTLGEISYHPNCTYSENFKPVINGTWQEDVDKVKREEEEARRLRKENPDEEEEEDKQKRKKRGSRDLATRSDSGEARRGRQERVI